MKSLGNSVDRTWDALASVKLTIVILLALLLLSIPGTVLMQYNISNVDPGLQYSYDFWSFGQTFQLFTAYHSFWYVGLMVLLSLNLIACSVNRWPQMLRLALAKPVLWSQETFLKHPKEHSDSWQTSLSQEEFKKNLVDYLESRWKQPVILQENAEGLQVFWQTGRWTRIANYLVHTSLLVIFAGAIISSLWGFEGAANIPSGGAVDTFLVFKEGKLSGLAPAPGGLVNEKLLGFRLRAKKFQVEFYEDFPGRPKSFLTHLEVQRDGVPLDTKSIVVNDPMEFEGRYFYQASYGRMGDFKMQLRAIDKKSPLQGQTFHQTQLGDPVDLLKYKMRFVALQALTDVQGLGPGVQFQALDGESPVGKPFWVLKNYPEFDFVNRDAPYALVIDELEELYFTGLQIGYDPGAPVYWWGCIGMLIGTFYALLVTHRKYHVHFSRGRVTLAAQIHRLPFGFEAYVKKLAQDLRQLDKQGVKT